MQTAYGDFICYFILKINWLAKNALTNVLILKIMKT
jgi:hypothetical protein